MAHAALKELFPAQVISFEQQAAERNHDRPGATSSTSAINRSPLQNETSTSSLDQSNLTQLLEILAQAALSHRAYEDDVRKLASRVDEIVKQSDLKVRQAEHGQREAEKRAQAAELRAGEAERWLRRLHDEIMRLFGSAKTKSVAAPEPRRAQT